MADRAPWRDLFETHLNRNSGTSFTLSTIAYDKQKRPVPRARTCEFRGFWPQPELHSSAAEALKEHGDEQNPPVYEGDLISLTTDVRMEKVGQIETTDNVVEAVFWLQDARTQWRLRGSAFVIGDPNGGDKEEAARREIMKAMKVCKDDVDGWTWDKQVTTYFANHSPAMRGSFKHPNPGEPRSRAPIDPDLKLGQKVDDIHDEVARANFRVVVILPDEVERLNVQNMERQIWTLKQNGDNEQTWVEEELWP